MTQVQSPGTHQRLRIQSVSNFQARASHFCRKQRILSKHGMFTWRFPKIGVPPVIIHFLMGFSMKIKIIQLLGVAPGNPQMISPKFATNPALDGPWALGTFRPLEEAVAKITTGGRLDSAASQAQWEMKNVLSSCRIRKDPKFSMEAYGEAYGEAALEAQPSFCRPKYH